MLLLNIVAAFLNNARIKWHCFLITVNSMSAKINLLLCFKHFFLSEKKDITKNKSHFCAVATHHSKYFELKLKVFRIKFSTMMNSFEIKKPPLK